MFDNIKDPCRPLPVFESKQATSLEKKITKRQRLAHADSALKIVATRLEESSIMDVLGTVKAVEEDSDVFFEKGDQNCLYFLFIKAVLISSRSWYIADDNAR